MTINADGAQTDALVERLFMGGVAALELLTIHVGHELGLYRALHQSGPLTVEGLASAAGIDTRYAQEWLEQQATAELLTVDDVAGDPLTRRYALAPGYADVLVDEHSLSYLAPMGGFVASFGETLPKLLRAYRDGSGVAYGDYGDAMRNAQAGFNRPAFENLLASEWIPNGLPDIDARLRSDGGARVADVGCGFGWSSIAIGKGYPKAQVDGYDTDVPSAEAATANAQAAGVSDRVRFRSDALQQGEYDLVCIFEALHDMSQPVEVLAASRAALKPGGCVLVMDERVAEEFGAIGDPIERLMYSYSVLHCLPAGLAEQPSVGTGTVMRPKTLERYASDAGFTTTTVLPVENDFFRFYRLDP